MVKVNVGTRIAIRTSFSERAAFPSIINLRRPFFVSTPDFRLRGIREQT